MHTDKLDDTINKYNNTYLNTIKIKQVDVKSNTCIDTSKEINRKILNSNLVIMLECQNIKNIFAKDYVPIGLKSFFRLKRIKNSLELKIDTGKR